MIWLALPIFLLTGGLALSAPNDPLPAAARKICQGTCTGSMAWIQEWEDSQDRLQIWEYQGDLRTCSHPPRLFYDASGQERGAVPEFPVQTKNPASVEKVSGYQKMQTSILEGLSPGKKWFCPAP